MASRTVQIKIVGDGAYIDRIIERNEELETQKLAKSISRLLNGDREIERAAELTDKFVAQNNKFVEDIERLKRGFMLDEAGEERPLPTVMERLQGTLCNATQKERDEIYRCLLYTSPSPRDS